MTGTDSDNVGIAMALVAGAGASTALGASVVFFPSLVKLASRRVLASALGLSAGVMTYVSFVEIFESLIKASRVLDIAIVMPMCLRPFVFSEVLSSCWYVIMW